MSGKYKEVWAETDDGQSMCALINGRWRKFCKSNGFGNLRFHELRHTQATLLISQGVDIKTVQNRLGHTLASTTLDLYAGVMPAKDREAADLINSIMAKK